MIEPSAANQNIPSEAIKMNRVFHESFAMLDASDCRPTKAAQVSAGRPWFPQIEVAAPSASYSRGKLGSYVLDP